VTGSGPHDSHANAAAAWLNGEPGTGGEGASIDDAESSGTHAWFAVSCCVIEDRVEEFDGCAGVVI
jgi:hypothetical protein